MDDKWLNGYLKGTTLDSLMEYGVKNKEYLNKGDLDLLCINYKCSN